MQPENTLGDIYEEIADQLATARTKALMGEHCEALGILQAASLEYTRFRDVLSAYPGFYALEHAFTTTLHSLREEYDRAATSVVQQETRKNPIRKRNRKAA